MFIVNGLLYDILQLHKDLKNLDKKFFVIPQLTDCFRKLNIGGAACLLGKILLNKWSFDFST